MYLPLNEDILCRAKAHSSAYKVSSLYEQGSAESNEDRLLVRENLYGVFDGATSLGSKELFNGLSGGGMAAQIANDSFLHTTESLFETAVEANRRIAIAQTSAGKDLSARESLWTTSMAVVRVAGAQLEFCQTGDSLIILIHEDGSYSLLIPEVDIDCETMTLWKELNSRGTRASSIYDELRSQIRKVRLQMNRDYGVLNGEPEAIRFLNHGSVSLSSVTDVLLFTDGLYLPKRAPEQPSDWSGLVQQYRVGGLQGLRDYVRKLQRSDPALSIYPRFKMHDDIAAVALQFKESDR
ncbi:protein phosphatase 2C domain-containing protein [Desulforhopalus sp. 52FAK]